MTTPPSDQAGLSEDRPDGAEAIAKILDQAKGPPHTPSPKTPNVQMAANRGVRAIVTELTSANRILTDEAGVSYLYQDGSWHPLSEQRLLAMVHRTKPGMSASMRRDGVAYLKAETYRLNLKWGRVAEYEMPCANGVLDVRSLKLRKHDPEDMLERVLPVAWEPDASCPRWMDTLASWFPSGRDGGRKAALQEFFGYICLSHAKYKQALLLYGAPNTGKSLAALLAKKLVGEKYACTLGVEHMDDPQRLALIKGKALNVITEVSADALIADGGFKTLISTEEPIFIDAKYRDPETYTPSAKHVIVTNNLPRLNDHTTATFERLLIIVYDVVIAKADQDRGLLDALIAELPGILVWAAVGASRLVARGGQWPEVDAAEAVLQQYREDLNPVRQFIAENMRRDPTDKSVTPLSRLTSAFNRWNSGARGFGVKYVGRLLRAAGYGDQIRQARSEGRNVWCLRGWVLVGEAPTQLYVARESGDADGLIEATATMPDET